MHRGTWLSSSDTPWGGRYEKGCEGRYALMLTVTEYQSLLK